MSIPNIGRKGQMKSCRSQHEKRAEVEDWIQGQQRREWRPAGRAVQATAARWTHQALHWELDLKLQETGQAANTLGGRSGRPRRNYTVQKDPKQLFL